MALLFDGRIRITTAANIPISGGKLRIYDANTTTLTTIYSNAALTVPLSNPVVAGSDGWCAQVFAAEGTAVDMQTETPVGVVLKTYVAVVFVGPASGTLTRDFGNSRLRINGSGGIVSIEGGDPSPDNNGGKLRLGGYNSTQADTLSLDAAATTLTGTLNPTGALTENSKKITGVVYTPSTTFTAATNVDIALPNAPSGVRRYRVDIWDLVCSTDAAIPNLRLAFDSVPTPKVGAGDYTYSIVYNSDGGAAGQSTTAAASSIRVALSCHAPTANQLGSMSFEVITVDSGTVVTLIKGETIMYDGTSNYPMMNRYAGACTGSYGRATYVRLFASAGTLTGKYSVTPLRGSGD